MQKYSTLQGPPGTGKSHFAIGLALYYPSARIVYTACSHAAVDALCEKALKYLPIDKCSRIIPARARTWLWRLRGGGLIRGTSTS